MIQALPTDSNAVQSSSVLVVGDIMLDRYWSGQTRRISPEAPVPVVNVATEEARVGGAANVAANAAALGAQVTLLGIVGNDAAADELERLCAEHRVTTALLRADGVTTPVKLRVIAQHQQLIRLDFERAYAHTECTNLTARFARLVRDFRVVVFSDYAKGALREVGEKIALAKAAGCIVVVDPKGTQFERYAGADVVTPNLHEFEAVAGATSDATDLVIKARKLCARFNFGALLVTRGEHGMTLVIRDGAEQHLAANARDVFDVTGAGDTVCAALAASLASGIELARATVVANRAAGIAVGKLGTAVVGAAELKASESPTKRLPALALTPAELLEAVTRARRDGLKIVMTNGCFDVLHTGHVRYLEEAAALGDRLLVAVNSDASVKRLKGASRPLNPLPARLEVLQRLRAVDWVISFDSDTPRELIAAVNPDILVKGGDYVVADIAGATEVLAAGGQVITLPFHAGYSSSNTIASLAAADTPRL